MVATMRIKRAVVMTPILIIGFRPISPAANAVAAVAPAQGKINPTARCAIRMAIEAGLNPIWTAAGMKTLQYSAVPEMKFVLMPTTVAAT